MTQGFWIHWFFNFAPPRYCKRKLWTVISFFRSVSWHIYYMWHHVQVSGKTSKLFRYCQSKQLSNKPFKSFCHLFFSLLHYYMLPKYHPKLMWELAWSSFSLLHHVIFLSFCLLLFLCTELLLSIILPLLFLTLCRKIHDLCKSTDSLFYIRTVFLISHRCNNIEIYLRGVALILIWNWGWVCLVKLESREHSFFVLHNCRWQEIVMVVFTLKW